MKKLLMFLVFLACCVVAGVYFYKEKFASPGYETNASPKMEEVSRGMIEEKVFANGKISPKGGAINVYPEIEGKVKSLIEGLKEGVMVKQGQPLLFLEDKGAHLEYRAMQDKVNLATKLAEHAQLAVKKAELERTQNELKLESAKERYASEVKKNETSIPGAALKTAKLELDMADAGIKLLDVAISDAKMKVEEAQLQVEAAKTGLAVADEKLKQYTITAPEDGVIIWVSAKKGDLVSPRKPDPSLFILAKESNSWEIQAQVSEQDVGKIIVGQKARFTVEASADKKDVIFTGIVRKINLIPSSKNSFSGMGDLNPALASLMSGSGGTNQQTNFTVTIDVDPIRSQEGKPEAKLGIGWTSSNAQIIIEKRENVILVPSASLGFTPDNLSSSLREDIAKRDKEGYQVVWTWERNQYSPIFVKAGATENGKTEIIESLDGKLKEKMKVVTEAPPKTNDSGLFNIKFKL